MKSLTKTIQESLHSVNEAKFKGKDILPGTYRPSNFGDKITDIKQLSKGSEYALLDLGMDTWQAGYEYTGKKGTIHVFKSTAQFDDSDLEFTDSELKDAVKGGEIYEMI